MLKSKVHRVTVTDANLGYVGSLTLDSALMEAADLYEYEQVDIVNVNNGARFSTYLITGGPGECCLNGAAARLGVVGDIIIVMSFDLVAESHVDDFKPKIVLVDEHNRDITQN
jgi:aspartate 1-decarboxylase